MTGILRAAAVSVDITPTGPLVMAASATPPRVARGTAERLEAQVLALLPEGQDPILIVGLDLLYAGAPLRAAVIDEARVPQDRVWVAASHSHRAPVTFASKPLLGSPDSAYMANLEQLIRQAIRRALSGRAQEVSLRVGTGHANHSVHRRRPVRAWRRGRPQRTDVRLAPLRKGSRDEQVAVIDLVTPDGHSLAVLWNYACHPVSHPVPDEYSAHYPGVVRQSVRTAAGDANLPVLFLQGFSGDTRPSDSALPSTPRDLLARALRGPRFFDLTDRRYDQWAGELAAIVGQIRARARAIESEPLSAVRVELPARDFVVVSHTAPPVPFQRLSLGRLHLIGVGAEVVSAYARLLHERAPCDHIVACVGCLDDPVGYLGTDAMVREGGYETDGFCEAFGVVAVRDGLQARVESGLRAVTPWG